MMLEKMKAVVDMIKDDRIQWFCTIVTPPDESKELIQEIKKYNYTYIHPYQASIQLWDLIMVADHHATYNFNDSIPKVLIDHGVGDSKVIVNSKERYHYARTNVLDKTKKPVYSCIFESSEQHKQEVINDIPALKGCISVVGHIEVDSILSLNKSRSELRNEFGYSDTDIVIFICSSHGDGSLLDSIGHELIEEALMLPNKYKIILASHFLNWQKTKNNEVVRGNSFLKYEGMRVRVLRPKDDFSNGVVVSDICLSDYTSASLFFTFLERPIIFIPFPEGVVSKLSSIWKLYCKAPRVNNVKDLHSIINDLPSYPKEILTRYSSELDSYPGEAKKRIKSELYRLLKLSSQD